MTAQIFVGNFREAHPTARLGRIAELRAEAELLDRGFEITHPAIDVGVDFFANGTGVQVKAARASQRNEGRQFSYGFRLKRVPGCADVYLLYGYDDDVWFVVPSEVAEEFGPCLNVNRLLNPNPAGRGRPSKSHVLHEWIGRWDIIGE